MAFGLFKKQVPQTAAPAAEAKVPQPSSATETGAAEGDSAREILELLELELGAMIRQLERAANSVAGGAEADRGDAFHHPPAHRCPDGPDHRRAEHGDDLLAGRRQVHPVGARHRLPGTRRRQARRPGQRCRPRSQRQCGSLTGVVGGDRQRRQSDRADRAADHAAGAQLHHRGRARRRGRAWFCRGRHRGEGARGADPERHRGDHQEDRGAAARRRGLGRRRASHLAGDRSDPPGVRQRQRRGRGAKRDHRRNGRQCGLRLQLHRLGRRQRDRDRQCDQGSRGARRKRRQGRPRRHQFCAEAQGALRRAAAARARKKARARSAASRKGCPAASRSKSPRRAA